MKSSKRAVIFCCSPRPGGNSDTAGEMFARGVSRAGGEAGIVALRDLFILPCVGCNRCAKDEQGRCFQEKDDQSRTFFDHLIRAPFILISSPVYFYHLPAQFKMFIDRSQSYYMRREKGDEKLAGLPERPAYLTMVAGRPRGEKLFEGSILTLRFFLKIFNIRLEHKLLFRGIDTAGDLADNEEYCRQIEELGYAGWNEFRKQ